MSMTLREASRMAQGFWLSTCIARIEDGEDCRSFRMWAMVEVEIGFRCVNFEVPIQLPSGGVREAF
jgi:hypothetical protein